MINTGEEIFEILESPTLNGTSAKANICATGIEYRRLDLPNENQFLNLGVFYDAGASEAPFCLNEHVFVIGGGNSAGQATMHFSRYATKVTMVIRGDNLATTLSHYLVKRISESEKIEVLFHSEVTGLDGDKELRQIEISDRRNGTKRVGCPGGSSAWTRMLEAKINVTADFLRFIPVFLSPGDPTFLLLLS